MYCFSIKSGPNIPIQYLHRLPANFAQIQRYTFPDTDRSLRYVHTKLSTALMLFELGTAAIDTLLVGKKLVLVLMAFL